HCDVRDTRGRGTSCHHVSDTIRCRRRPRSHCAPAAAPPHDRRRSHHAPPEVPVPGQLPRSSSHSSSRDDSRRQSRGYISSTLLARSDLPRAAKGAIAASQALARPALVALVVGVIAAFLSWPLVAWTAVIV